MAQLPFYPRTRDDASSVAVDNLDGENSQGASAEVSIPNLPSPEDGEVERDVERTILLKPQKADVPSSTLEGSTRTAAFWMGINTLATVDIVRHLISGIRTLLCRVQVIGVQVFANKAILSDPTLKHMQISFAAFHFVVTWLALFVMSRPQIGMFTSREGSITQFILLTIAMSLNVILTNLSLAYSTVTFYQVSRIHLTLTVASMNFILYRSTLPRDAIYAVVPACWSRNRFVL
jgi:solute carrier family 35 protein E3